MTSTTTHDKRRDARIKARRELRASYIAEFGGKCIRCGATQRLEFDHIEPSTKLPELISRKRMSLLDLPKDIREAELAKCQLLCRPCHRRKHGFDIPAGHGTITSYTNYKCRCKKCRDAQYVRGVRNRERRKVSETALAFVQLRGIQV